MKKSCELCSKPARMYCDSDQASLCWNCDERVHCANFLVAKHSRSLLCHVCQSPTPWKASGTRLSPTLSVCESCMGHFNGEEGEEIESVGDEDCGGSEAESDEDQYIDSNEEYDDEDTAEEEEEDGEKNQVVPWSLRATPSSSAPPGANTSSSGYGSFSTREGGGVVASAFKRLRNNPHLDSDEEEGCSSSQVHPKTASMEDNGASIRAPKKARTDAFSDQHQLAESSAAGERGETETRKMRSLEVLSSFMRFQQRMICSEHNASEIIQGISKLSSDTRTVGTNNI